MKRKNEGKTFKQQLFLYFILSSVFICLVMGLFLYVSEQKLITDNLQQETQTAMGYAVDQAEQTALRVEEFANQVCRSDAVIDVMQRTSPQVDAQVLDIAAELNEQFQFVTITEEVLSLLLVGENGLDLRCGKEASLVDDVAVKQGLLQGGLLWRQFDALGGLAEKFLQTERLSHCGAIQPPHYGYCHRADNGVSGAAAARYRVDRCLQAVSRTGG